MKLTTVKTVDFKPGSSTLEDLLKYLKNKISEDCVIAISSKVISICSGNTTSIGNTDHQQLVTDEADAVLTKTKYGTIALTRKQDYLVEYAGVDRVTRHNIYAKLPKDGYQLAYEIWLLIKNMYNLTQFGLIITDSHSVPFRKGAVGYAIGAYGFDPLICKEIQNTKTHNTYSALNLMDSIAASANIHMGEFGERKPIVIVEDIPNISFFTDTNSRIDVQEKLAIKPEDEIYSVFNS